MFIDFFIKNLAIITNYKSSFEMKLEVLSIGQKILDSSFFLILNFFDFLIIFKIKTVLIRI